MNFLKTEIYRLTGPEELVLQQEEISLQDLEPDAIIAETIYSAISPGTETAAYSGMEPLRPGKIYPRLMGYCNVARIIATGKDVSEVKQGDYILTFQSHRSHFKISSKDFFIRLPEVADPSIFTTAYLYHLGFHALHTAGIRPGHHAGIIGAGVLGYTTACMSLLSGAMTFVFSSQPEAKQKLSKKGIPVLDKTDASINQVTEKTNTTGLDVLVNTSNTWADWQFALQAVNKGGTIVNLGFPGRGQGVPAFNPLDPQYVYTKFLTIKALCSMSESDLPVQEVRFTIRRNLEYIIQLIRDGRLQPDEIITDTIHYTDLAGQYKRYMKKDRYMLSTLIEWKK